MVGIAGVHHLQRLIAVTILGFILTNCSRNPQVIKNRYVTTGDVYFSQGKYKEAEIMYRRSIGVDLKYGVAYSKLAATYLKLGQPANAYPALRKAVELLPTGSQDLDLARLNLGELLLIGVQSVESEARRSPYLRDVSALTKQLFNHDPKSYEGHKLTADLLLTSSVQAIRKSNLREAKQTVGEAIVELRAALAARPGEPIASLSLARTLAFDGQTVEAEPLFQSVIKRDPRRREAYIELYGLYKSQGRGSEAEAILLRAIAANPKDGTLRAELAAHFWRNGNRQEGEKALDAMKKDFQDFRQAYFVAGDWYLQTGDAAQAIQQYETGERVDKTHRVEYRKRVVLALMQQGKSGEAYAKTLEILKESPKDPESRGLNAAFLLEKGDVDHAIAELGAVLTTLPGDPVAHFQMGRARYAKREWEQARQEFEKSVQLRPDYLPPRLALAQLSLARNDSAQALKQTADALKINPKSGEAKLLQSAAQMRSGNYKDARATLDSILKNNPQQAATLLESGVLSFLENRYGEAAATFRQAYSADSSNPKGLFGEAEISLLQNKPDDAVNLVQTEVDRHPNRPDLKRGLADLQFRTGHFEQAITNYRALISTSKGNPAVDADLYARIADSYIAQKQFLPATAELRKAQGLSPGSPTLTNSLALLLERSGNHSEARKLYEQSIAKQGDNPQALNNLAFLIAETGGNLDQALTLATRAKQKLPNRTEVSDTIGWIYLKKNLSDSAVAIFRDLTEKVPASPTFHFHYAMALAQKGDKANASRQLQLALANKPGKEEESRIRELMSRI